MLLSTEITIGEDAGKNSCRTITNALKSSLLSYPPHVKNSLYRSMLMPQLCAELKDSAHVEINALQTPAREQLKRCEPQIS